MARATKAAEPAKPNTCAFGLQDREYSAEVLSVVQQSEETNSGVVTTWKIGLAVTVDPSHLINSQHLHRHFKLVPRTLGKAQQQTNLEGDDIDINAFHVFAMEGVSEKCNEVSYGFNAVISDGKKKATARVGSILLKQVKRDDDKNTEEPGCTFIMDLCGIPWDGLPKFPLKGQTVDIEFEPKPEKQLNDEAKNERKAKASKGQADLGDEIEDE